MLGVRTGHAAPMVMDTLTPSWSASSKTCPRMSRCSGDAHALAENAISTSPNPALAMAPISRTASAPSSGPCHHQRVAGRYLASGFLNSAAVNPPASAPGSPACDETPSSEPCSFTASASSDRDAPSATVSAAVSSARPPAPASNAVRRRPFRPTSRALRHASTRVARTVPARRRWVACCSTVSPPRPGGRTPANAISHSSAGRPCALMTADPQASQTRGKLCAYTSDVNNFPLVRS